MIFYVVFSLNAVIERFRLLVISSELRISFQATSIYSVPEVVILVGRLDSEKNFFSRKDDSLH